MTWRNTPRCIHGKLEGDPCLECGEVKELFSPQYLWQVRQYRAGNCINCGQSRGRSLYKRRCKECGQKAAGWQRERTGSEKWKKGGRGRPPLTNSARKPSSAPTGD